MKEVEDGALGKSQRWNKTSSWRLTKGCLVTRFLNCKFTMVVVGGGCGAESLEGFKKVGGSNVTDSSF